MEVEEKRDQKTVAIGAALGIFALVVLVGTVMLWFAYAFGASDGLVTTLQRPLFAVAGLALIVYLVLHRR